MPVAFTLINTEVGKIDEALSNILKVEEVVEAYSVAGPYAILAKIETKEFEKLTKVVPEEIHQIKEIKDTLTLLAFGVSKEFRVDACEKAGELAKRGTWKTSTSFAGIVNNSNFAPMARD